VIAEPLEAPPPSRPAILLLNTGANHRVGSNRMYVAMARAWAAAGFVTLRFDLSGIGDSPARGDARENDVYSARGVSEAQAAMRFLSARGRERFILGGLCSGAYVSFHAGVHDSRVAGVILINPLTFHWKEGDSLEIRTRKTFKSTRFYARAMTDAATWRRTFSGDIHVRAILRELGTRAVKRVHGHVSSLAARVTGGGATDTTDIASGFRAMCDRGVEVMLVFGADDGGIDVMEEHLGVGARKLHKKKGFRLEIIDGPDHTFTPLWSQRHLRDLLTQHLVTRFGG
jgi:dienelactone hydrolase